MQKLTRGNRIGGACLALGGLIYLLAERISALAWQHPLPLSIQLHQRPWRPPVRLADLLPAA
ncbi:hypothetical protein [Erwinia aphidicola]|uniref:hypothetical protein n=1 Tax=Erwinia aphidicola TaxID=68334 RepID=UPI0030D013CB